MSSSADVLMTQTRTSRSARPGAPSTTPMPHLVRPGSTPSTRIGCCAKVRLTRLSVRHARTSVRSVAMNLPAGGGQVAHRARRVGTGILTICHGEKRLMLEGHHGPFGIKRKRACAAADGQLSADL